MNRIEGVFCTYTLTEYIRRSNRLSRLEAAADAVIKEKEECLIDGEQYFDLHGRLANAIEDMAGVREGKV